MTIHKAKGLEFDAVILLDLEQTVSNNRGTSLLAERQSRLDAPTAVWIRPRSNVIEHHPRLAKAEAEGAGGGRVSVADLSRAQRMLT